jgi:LuxR family maltose regulon positive regulatory protein
VFTQLARVSPVLPAMLLEALRAGIEPEYATEVARRYRVAPPAGAPQDWPWPIKIYTLGKFELLLDGQPVEFHHKAPKRTLAVLPAIIAVGGREVSEEQLLEALWPDEAGDAAHRALTSAMHRLRKLLGDHDAIHQTRGKISIDPQRCWVDVLAFEEGLSPGGIEGVIDEGLQRALALYRGPFLGTEEHAPWAIPMRERLRGKFVHALTRFAQRLEEEERFDDAIPWYLRGLDADDLIELFYQGLMRCYTRLDRRPEALSAYRRLRQTLSVALGVQPSRATQRLFDELRLSEV